MAAFILYSLFFVLCNAVVSARTVPGLDFIPRPNPSYHRDALIRMFYRDRKTYEGFLATLNATEKAPGDNVVNCDARAPVPRPPGKVCLFDHLVLGPCTKRNAFGYEIGQPCILLQLNTLAGWEPTGNSGITVECHGKYPPDKDNIGKLEYYPSTRKIAPYFFPFNNQPDYMAPLVAVKFTRLATGVIVFVECTASDAQGEVGRTNFEILLD